MTEEGSVGPSQADVDEILTPRGAVPAKQDMHKPLIATLLPPRSVSSVMAPPADCKCSKLRV